MKAIMLSVRPEWVEKILNKEKTIEIRKSKPSCELPVKVYIYCTKERTSLPVTIDIGGYAGSYEAGGHHANYIRVNKKHFLYKTEDKCFFDTLDCDRLPRMKERCNKLNGKVVAEFTLNKVDKIEICDPDILINGKQCSQPHLEQSSRLKISKIMEYIGYGNDHDGWGKDWSVGYAWHIDDLHIYDKPKELSEFKRECDGNCISQNKTCIKVKNKMSDIWSNCSGLLTITRPFQSWGYCEELED